MSVSSPTTRVTPEEYLIRERQAEYKSEYVDGEIRAMTGASRNHNRIVLNIGAHLHAQMRGRPCEAYISEMRVRVRRTGLYAYPDVVALCGEPEAEDERTDTLLNPSVIVEVLSPSTQSFDRGDKFAHYRRLESLEQYVLVAQDRVRVESYLRRGEEWVLSETTDPAAELAMPSVGCAIVLRDLYERVELAEGDAAP